MAKPIPSDNITKQLFAQSVDFSILSAAELLEVNSKWRKKFIGTKTAPHIDDYKWHIFSFEVKACIEGEKAIQEYVKQYPCDLYIFNEDLEFGIKCLQTHILPIIDMKDYYDDIYICHHNMKWTYVITHESPFIGPYFCY